jgi:hypothetical protein
MPGKVTDGVDHLRARPPVRRPLRGKLHSAGTVEVRINDIVG